MALVLRSLRACLDLLIPRGCAVCDEPLAADDGRYCAACAIQVGKDAAADYCPRCGATAEPYTVGPTGCPLCREEPTPVAAVARAGSYGGAVGALVKRFKFGGQQRLDDTLAELLTGALPRQVPIDEIDALVPVPADWGAWWRYRFHPAGALARCVGRRLGLPVRPIVRVARWKLRQTRLPASRRAANVRGVFRMARGVRPAGATLCVIDDVSTTGATLREMARVLKTAGAVRVFACVVAKTQLGLDDHAGGEGRMSALAGTFDG